MRVDLFTSAWNNQLSFCKLVSSNKNVEDECFFVGLEFDSVFLFPPFNLIPICLMKLIRDRFDIISSYTILAKLVLVPFSNGDGNGDPSADLVWSLVGKRKPPKPNGSIYRSFPTRSIVLQQSLKAQPLPISYSEQPGLIQSLHARSPSFVSWCNGRLKICHQFFPIG